MMLSDLSSYSHTELLVHREIILKILTIFSLDISRKKV